jgi:sugar/nucleoside kinase (ribokinase family)|tara:strand:- start:599 stop:964 length:366 start_codon:yes stop_codon:yes gene_type:complete
MRPSFDDKHRLLPSEITPAQFTGAKWVVVNGYSYYSDGFLEAACDAASIAGAKVAMHLASFEIVRKFRTPLTSLLASGKVSVVFANEDEARELVGGGDASSESIETDTKVSFFSFPYRQLV